MKKIKVAVKPGSKKGPLIEELDGRVTVFVRERAFDSAANQAVIKLLAKHFGVAKSRVQLRNGVKSKFKTFLID